MISHDRQVLGLSFIPGAFFVKCARSLCVYMSFYPQLKAVRLNLNMPVRILSVYIEALRQS